MNGIRSRIGLGLAGAAGFSLVLLAPPAMAEDSNAAPPTPEAASQTTNAMLQPGDVPAVLGSASGVDIGYDIPPGGQDPFPICYESGEFEVLPSRTDAIGYSSRADQVTEEIYVYPSAESAQAAWNVLDRQISRKCTFVDVDGKNRVRSRQGQLADGAGRWVRMDLTYPDSPAFYSAVGLVDNGIVITRFQGNKGLTQTTADQRAATDALFAELATRYANRATLGQVQPAAMTSAQQALLQPADIPAALPIQQPANGAWASQRAKLPGEWPFNRCAPRKALLPSGTGYYSQSLGSSGDVFIRTGLVYQQVLSYDSAESAQAAWNRLNKTIKDCDETVGKLYATGGNRKTVTGSVDVNGMPGLFIRATDTENYGRGNSFVTKDYTVFTLSGDTIMSVLYGRSMMGMKRFTIDEAAVRQLTATAAGKWSQGSM